MRTRVPEKPERKVPRNVAWGHPLQPFYSPDDKHQRRYRGHRTNGGNDRNRPNKMCPVCRQRVYPQVASAYPVMNPVREEETPTWVWTHRTCLSKDN
jgi:hypothetical protein